MARLKTQLFVNAASRLADSEIIPFYVLKKGDADSGALFVEVEEDSQNSILYSWSLSFEGDYEFIAISGDAAKPRYEIAEQIEREIARDADCWVVSVAGQKGLLLFSQIG
ncbi:MAG: DUF1491 family protein [Candidatus Puniceispirillaceae bacterium]